MKLQKASFIAFTFMTGLLYGEEEGRRGRGVEIYEVFDARTGADGRKEFEGSGNALLAATNARGFINAEPDLRLPRIHKFHYNSYTASSGVITAAEGSLKLTQMLFGAVVLLESDGEKAKEVGERLRKKAVVVFVGNELIFSTSRLGDELDERRIQFHIHNVANAKEIIAQFVEIGGTEKIPKKKDE